MKKLSIYLGIILALFALLYYLNYASTQKANDQYAESALKLYQTTPDKLYPETKELLKDSNYQNIIIPKDLDEQLANQKSLLVYYFSPLCPYCMETTPILSELAAETGAAFSQMNVYQFQEEWQTRNISATPTLIRYVDGKEAARIEGGIGNHPGNTKEDFKNFLLAGQ